MILEARAITGRYRKGPPLRSSGWTARWRGRNGGGGGTNGSGKTTLVRALLDCSVEQGSVAGGGRQWELASRRARASGRGLGQQEEAGLRLNVAETVMLGRYARRGPLSAPRAEDRNAVRAALERCDIVGIAERSIDSLSGGEWKRVPHRTSARPGTPRPSTGRPTASLDVRHEMELFELFVSWSTVVSRAWSHSSPQPRRPLCRRIILLDRASSLRGESSRGDDRETLSRVLRVAGSAVTTWSDGSPQVVPLRGERSRNDTCFRSFP